MPNHDLQNFVRELETSGELIRVVAEVDPCLEIAAIINRVCKSEVGNKALLFESVKGSDIPLAANLYGSQKRILAALDVDSLATLTARIIDELKQYSDLNSHEALVRMVKPVIRAPVTSHCQETLTSGLDGLPALKSWPGDGGRYLTLGQVFTVDPNSGKQNCGMYRVQIVGAETALLRCHPGSGGDAHIQAWQERGDTMPIAIVLGGPPALTWAAGVSLPNEIDETDFINFLLNQEIPLSQCDLSDLTVPAAAEIVIEGEIVPGEQRLEGPFGNHTGFYIPAAPAPVIRVKQVRYKKGAIYPCTVVGPPPMENAFLALAAERYMLPLLQHDNRWVKDIHMPLATVYHRVAFVTLSRCEEPLAAIIKGLWASTLLKKARLIVLLDDDCELRNINQVYWRVINTGAWGKQVVLDDDRLVIDARSNGMRTVVKSDPQTLQRVNLRWTELGLGQGSLS